MSKGFITHHGYLGCEINYYYTKNQILKIYLTCDALLGLLETGDDSKGTKSLLKPDSLFAGEEAAETVPKMGNPGIPLNLCNKLSGQFWLTRVQSHVLSLSFILSVKMPMKQPPSPINVNEVICAVIFHAICFKFILFL
jgi:hypothetical protein